MSKKFHIITLGCKVNQYESEAVREAWLMAGHEELPTASGADVVLVNSCAITAKAVADLRNLTRKVRRLSPDCEVLVTGCASEAMPSDLATLPVDKFFSRKDQMQILGWLDSGTESTLPSSTAEQTELAGSSAFWSGSGPDEDLYEGHSRFPAFSISGYARSRAVLKIHDGCSQHCTYCIVPQGRGPSVSRPWAESIAEAGRLISAGFREIVLSGVNLRQYGMDLNQPHSQVEDFWSLVQRLQNTFGAEWGGKSTGADELSSAGRLRFRISSLEPGQLDEKSLSVLSFASLVAPHLHLSLQSGSKRTLKRMGRGHYDPALIPDFLAKLQKIWPTFGLGADFITGFPGETEEDFAETLKLVEALPLTYAHVFPYSMRPGTAAAKLGSQLPQEVKKERAEQLRNVVAEKKVAFLQSQLSFKVLWLAPDEHKNQGVNEYYADCLAPDGLPEGKELVPVRPLYVEGEKLIVKAL